MSSTELTPSLETTSLGASCRDAGGGFQRYHQFCGEMSGTEKPLPGTGGYLKMLVCFTDFSDSDILGFSQRFGYGLVWAFANFRAVVCRIVSYGVDP